MTTPLDLALEYASKGIPVFPCRAAAETTDQVDPDTGEFITLEEKHHLRATALRVLRPTSGSLGLCGNGIPTP